MYVYVIKRDNVATALYKLPADCFAATTAIMNTTYFGDKSTLDQGRDLLNSEHLIIGTIDVITILK